MKFSPGDPVWARSVGNDPENSPPAGEYPAVVISQPEEFWSWYTIEAPTIINSKYGGHIFYAKEPFLRPRRDDYQQREPRVTRADIDRILSEPTPAEAWTKETAVSGY